VAHKWAVGHSPASVPVRGTLGVGTQFKPETTLNKLLHAVRMVLISRTWRNKLLLFRSRSLPRFRSSLQNAAKQVAPAQQFWALLAAAFSLAGALLHELRTRPMLEQKQKACSLILTWFCFSRQATTPEDASKSTGRRTHGRTLTALGRPPAAAGCRSVSAGGVPSRHRCIRERCGERCSLAGNEGRGRTNKRKEGNVVWYPGIKFHQGCCELNRRNQPHIIYQGCC